jgi:hypothetical protein
MACDDSALIDFSGVFPLISSAPDATKIISNGPEIGASAASTDASTVTSSPSPDRDNPVTSQRCARNASAKADPIPPDAPIIKALFMLCELVEMPSLSSICHQLLGAFRNLREVAAPKQSKSPLFFCAPAAINAHMTTNRHNQTSALRICAARPAALLILIRL